MSKRRWFRLVLGSAAAVAIIAAGAVVLNLGQTETPPAAPPPAAPAEPTPGVPAASVDPASDVTSTEATLSGSIESVSMADLRKIEFSFRGPDGSGRVIPARVVIDGSAERAEARLGRLRPGTEYTYSLRVELDGLKIVDSGERSFRTSR